MFLPRTLWWDRIGRLREVPRRDGRVEVRWADDWSKGMADAAELVENPGGWDALQILIENSPALNCLPAYI